MMKKLLWLLLIAAILLLLWQHFKPAAPDPSKIASVVTTAPDREQDNANNNQDDSEDSEDSEEETDEQEEDQTEPFVPEKPLGDVVEADGEVEVADTEGAITYTIAPESTVAWIGRKVGGQHNGSINITKGDIDVLDGSIVGGSFTMDMNSIKTLDIDNEGLDNKIKGWFNADKHPEAMFEVGNVSATTIEGVMTINGISKGISFPAVVVVEDDTVIAKADFALDRNERDVAGGTPSVSEFMELSFSLTWNK